MNPLVPGSQQPLMSSYDFWKQVNLFRVEECEVAIRHNDFLNRIRDECPEVTVQNFRSVPYNDKSQTIQAADLNHDQMMLVGMRESKAVRKRGQDQRPLSDSVDGRFYADNDNGGLKQ